MENSTEYMHIDVRVWWVKNTPSEFASHLIIPHIAQVRNIHCGFALNAVHVQKKKTIISLTCEWCCTRMKPPNTSINFFCIPPKQLDIQIPQTNSLSFPQPAHEIHLL